MFFSCHLVFKVTMTCHWFYFCSSFVKTNKVLYHYVCLRLAENGSFMHLWLVMVNYTAFSILTQYIQMHFTGNQSMGEIRLQHVQAPLATTISALSVEWLLSFLTIFLVKNNSRVQVIHANLMFAVASRVDFIVILLSARLS